jgi:rhodanese-related sulfurtransferase
MQGLKALDPAEFEAEKANGTLVLDVRDAQSFAKGFVPGSLNIGLRGSFAPWVGALVTNIRRPILLVVQDGDEREAVIRLARVGYDNVVGYLKGGIDNWRNEGKVVDTIKSISATEFETVVNDDKNLQVLDVRNVGEYLSEHLLNAQNYPLGDLSSTMDSLDTNATYYIHCAGGYRSMVAASLLHANGFKNLIDIAGGYKSLKETKLEKTDYVCPSKINV